ncbi:MAG: hypothetical protein WAT92_09685 [Saprospiraceae bacterium]
MTYDEISEHDKKYLGYQQLLGMQEWKNIRNTVTNRDQKKCLNCGKKSTESLLDGYFVKIGSPKNHFYEIDDTDDPHLRFKLIITDKVVIHVHHTFYDISKLPWEYPIESLQTLCSDCHQDLHDKNSIPIYDHGELIKDIDICSRCNGSGYLHEFNYHKNGICFKCNGARFYIKKAR